MQRYTLHILLITASCAQQIIPFCSYCECEFASHDAVHLDCTNTDMKAILFDNYYWYDDYNATYRVATLKARNSNLDGIDRQFPSSTLRTLDLSGNAIGRIIEGAFSNLQYLQELNLANNTLAYVKPDLFKGVYFVGEYRPLKQLKVLQLQRNKLTVLHQKTFEHIKQIEELYLGYNPFGEIATSTQIALKSLKALRVLDLRCTNLDQLPNDLFFGEQHFQQLEVLDLSENLFTVVPKVLQDLVALETLFFDANPIVELDAKSGFVNAMNNLKVVHLSDMPNLEVIQSRSLSGLQLLDELYMHNNVFLSQINERAFYTDITPSDLPQLRVLDLYNCNLTRMSADFLPHWRTLDRLNISQNPWICDCYNQGFIEIVALARPDEAKSVFCVWDTNNNSFFHVKETGVVLPCPSIHANFGNFRSMFILVVFVNVCGVFLCCLCKKRFRRAGMYFAVRNV